MLRRVGTEDAQSLQALADKEDGNKSVPKRTKAKTTIGIKDDKVTKLKPIADKLGSTASKGKKKRNSDDEDSDGSVYPIFKRQKNSSPNSNTETMEASNRPRRAAANHIKYIEADSENEEANISEYEESDIDNAP